MNIRMSRHDAIVLTKYRKPVVMSAISSIGKSMEHIRLLCQFVSFCELFRQPHVDVLWTELLEPLRNDILDSEGNFNGGLWVK